MYNIIWRLGNTVQLTMIVFTVVFSVLLCLVVSSDRGEDAPSERGEPGGEQGAPGGQGSEAGLPPSQTMMGQDGCCDLPGKYSSLLLPLQHSHDLMPAV